MKLGFHDAAPGVEVSLGHIPICFWLIPFDRRGQISSSIGKAAVSPVGDRAQRKGQNRLSVGLARHLTIDLGEWPGTLARIVRLSSGTWASGRTQWGTRLSQQHLLPVHKVES